MSFNQHKRLSIKMQELKGIHGNMNFDQTISELRECYNRGKTNEVNMIFNQTVKWKIYHTVGIIVFSIGQYQNERNVFWRVKINRIINLNHYVIILIFIIHVCSIVYISNICIHVSSY